MYTKYARIFLFKGSISAGEHKRLSVECRFRWDEGLEKFADFLLLCRNHCCHLYEVVVLVKIIVYKVVCWVINTNVEGSNAGFPKLFFLKAPFLEIKKAMAPSNKVTQKTTIT